MKVINVTRARKEKISKESILAVAEWNLKGYEETGNIRYFQQANDLKEVASKLGAKKKVKPTFIKEWYSPDPELLKTVTFEHIAGV